MEHAAAATGEKLPKQKAGLHGCHPPTCIPTLHPGCSPLPCTYSTMACTSPASSWTPASSGCPLSRASTPGRCMVSAGGVRATRRMLLSPHPLLCSHHRNLPSVLSTRSSPLLAIMVTIPAGDPAGRGVRGIVLEAFGVGEPHGVAAWRAGSWCRTGDPEDLA